MRRVIPFLLLAASLLFALGTAEGKALITEGLEEKIARSSDAEFIPVIIMLEEQARVDDLQAQVLGQDPESRRRTVVAALRQTADASQADLLRHIEVREKSGTARLIRSLWIVNVVAAEATKEVIEEISNLDGIQSIEFDEVVNLLLEDRAATDLELVPAGPATTAIPVEANIEKVRAPEVWEQGYTGKCIIVGVLDTGVNYTHADLADHMWVDPEGAFPLHGFDFVNTDIDPMDDHGHGTHVSGTVAGDGTAGRATGVAPDAAIMAIKVLDASGSANPSFTNVWAGVQFGVEQGAHVLSLSLGRRDATEEVRKGSRLTFTNALLAGVVSAVAAGNERGDPPPVPRNIRNPGDCPPPWLHPDQEDLQVGGICGVITVGATTVDDDIGYLSSQGPSVWDIADFGFDDYPHPPGLLDPDVCAPGINITSLDAFDPTGYAFGWNGTSMATPHVSGAIALMLQKSGGLSPAHIDSILEMTSVDLGPAGKDNDFGTGRIDVLEAVNALPGAGVMDLAWSIIDKSFAPPDPWVQEGLLIDSICVIAGEDLLNLRFIADALQCDDVPCEADHVKEIHHHNVQFVPQEIAFVRAGETVCAEVKVSVPVGQHAGIYAGEVHVIAETDDPCLLAKVSRDLALTVDVLPAVDMDVDDNHGNVSDNVMHLRGAKTTQVSGTFTVVNPNSEAKNVDLDDGPGNIRIEPVSVTSTDLVKIGDPGEVIPAGAISFGTLLSLASGEAIDVQLDVDIPDGIPVNAVYRGSVTVTYDECVHSRRPARHMLAGPVSDEFTLEVEVLPTQGPLDIVDAVLSEDFCPPDPWTQVGQIEYFFQIAAEGDHRNIRISSGGLEHESLDKKLDQFNFFPEEIAFLAAGETREVKVIAKVPIGQHSGSYSGVFRVVSETGGEDSVLVSADVCAHPDLDIEDDLGNLSANVMHLEAPREGVAYGTFNFVNPNLPDNNADLVDGPGNIDLTDLTAVPSDLWFAGGGSPPKEPIPASMISIDLYPDPALLGSGAGGFGVVQVSIPKWAHHWVPGYSFEYWGDVELSALSPGDTVSDGFKVTLRVLKRLGGGGPTSGFWGERDGDANQLYWSALGLSETGYALYRDGARIAELPEGSYQYADPVTDRTAREYVLGVSVGGSEIMLGPVSVGGKSLPLAFYLSQNSPNPFSGTTVIRYQTPVKGPVSLRVYDVSGELVTVLDEGEKPAGFHTVEWNGRYDSGREAANGVYFYRLASGSFEKSGKMILLR